MITNKIRADKSTFKVKRSYATNTINFLCIVVNCLIQDNEQTLAGIITTQRFGITPSGLEEGRYAIMVQAILKLEALMYVTTCVSITNIWQLQKYFIEQQVYVHGE